MTRTGWIALLVLILFIAGGVWLWTSSSSAPSGASASGTQLTGTPQPTDAGGAAAQSQPSDQLTGTVTANTSVNAGGAPMTASVTYDGNYFSPASVTIAQGGTVTFTDTSGSMWIASDPHPTHTGYDGTTRAEHCAAGYTGSAPFDQCSSGSSFSFTFNKVGTFGYHDHTNAGVRGSVTVVAR